MTIDVIVSDPEPVHRIVREIVDSAWEIVCRKMNSEKEPGDETDSSEVENIKMKPKIFPCQTCGNFFSQFESAAKHCIVKMANLSAICPLCGKAIKEKRNLKRHIKTHAVKSVVVVRKKGIPECEGCGKVFSSNQKLDEHMVRKHEVQKPTAKNTEVIKCTKCTFSHVNRSVLKAHFSKAHAQDVRINCDHCDYYCLSDSGMRKHKKKAHKPRASEDNSVGEVLMPPPAASSNHADFGLPQTVGQAPLYAAVHQAYRHVEAASWAPPPPSGFDRSRYAPLPAAPQVPIPIVSGLAQHNTEHLTRHHPPASSDNMDIDDFLSQNFGNSNFGLSRIYVTEDGKELMKL